MSGVCFERLCVGPERSFLLIAVFDMVFCLNRVHGLRVVSFVNCCLSLSVCSRFVQIRRQDCPCHVFVVFAIVAQIPSFDNMFEVACVSVQVFIQSARIGSHPMKAISI